MDFGDFYVGFIGEYNKWVPVSPQRFTGFDQNYYRATISMRGVVNEIVAMRFLVHKKVISCFKTHILIITSMRLGTRLLTILVAQSPDPDERRSR